MDPNITTQGASDLKRVLGLALGGLIHEFEERTGLEVTSVDLRRDSKRELVGLFTTVELR